MTGWILLGVLYAIGLAGYTVRDMVEGEGYWYPRLRYLAWPIGVLSDVYEKRIHARIVFDAWHITRQYRIQHSNDVWGDNLRTALTKTEPKV